MRVVAPDVTHVSHGHDATVELAQERVDRRVEAIRVGEVVGDPCLRWDLFRVVEEVGGAEDLRKDRDVGRAGIPAEDETGPVPVQIEFNYGFVLDAAEHAEGALAGHRVDRGVADHPAESSRFLARAARPARLVAGGLAFQLAPGSEPVGGQPTVMDGGRHRTARLAVVPAVREAAVAAGHQVADRRPDSCATDLTLE